MHFSANIHIQQQSMLILKITNLTASVCVFLTKVIVAHHGIRSTQAWALLGEVVSELQQSSVLLQNISYLHLNLITQRLALYHTYTNIQDINTGYNAVTRLDQCYPCLHSPIHHHYLQTEPLTSWIASQTFI